MEAHAAPRSKRYSAEILTGDAGKLWDTAWITQLCRDTLQALGTPSGCRLLIASPFHEHGQGRTVSIGSDFAGIGEHTMEPFGLLADDGSPLSVSLRRLRLSEQVLNHRARQTATGQ